MSIADSSLRFGLDAATAAERLREFGPNELVPQRRSGALLTWLLRLVGDPMVVLLVIAGATYFALGDRFDGIIVLVALAPIFLVGAVLEYRSDRALERLHDISPLRATIVRDGQRTSIPARLVVPGDVLILNEGDVVAADAKLLESRYLLVDEMSLTGESLPVEKRRDARVLAGTVVRSGSGRGVVVDTGPRTEYGRIGGELASMQPHQTPIEQSIRKLVFQVGIAVVLVCALVLGVQRWHGDTWAVAVIAAVSLAMAAIPEELPMVYTLYLALGAFRLAKDNALVRRLSSVETLGSTSVICVDKTGTLTHGRLAVEAVFFEPGAGRGEVLQIAALASPAESKDPLDQAILAEAGLLNRAAVIEEIPFDPERAWSAAIVRGGARFGIFMKGAYEALSLRTADPSDAGAEEFIRNATFRGARVIAVAKGTLLENTAGARDNATIEIVGLIAFSDPVREAARSAVAECGEAGIRFIMLTGDHPETARAIASNVGLDARAVVTRSQLTGWSDSELADRIEGVDVFARVRPEDKLRIVRALHARGEVVAMTGDGTNDALALREADIGVAMGKTGTEVARAAADLVLLDDDVTTIVRAIADGRRIFHNLRHAFSYLNAFHAPLLLSAFVLPLLGVPILLLPIHLIWLEIIVHPTSALVFEGDPPELDLMKQSPRPASEGLLRPHDWQRAMMLGTTLAAMVIAIYLVLLHLGFDQSVSRGAAILAMIVGQTALVFIERAGSRPLWSVSLKGNAVALPIIALTIASLAAALWFGPLAAMLHIAAPPLRIGALALVLGLIAVLWTQPYYLLKQEPAHV